MSNVINLAQYINDPQCFQKLREKRLIRAQDDQPLYDHVSTILEYKRDLEIAAAYKAEMKVKRIKKQA